MDDERGNDAVLCQTVKLSDPLSLASEKEASNAEAEDKQEEAKVVIPLILINLDILSQRL